MNYSPLEKSRKVLPYFFAQRVILGLAGGLVGPLIPFIAINLSVGLDKIGAAISFSVIAIFIISLVLNNFIDILGYKTVLLAGLIMLSAGSLGLFFSGFYWFFIVSLIFYQMGNGILSIAIFSIIGGLHFEEKSLRIMQTTIYYSLGSIIAPLLVSLFAGVNLNWQFIFLSVAVMQAILGIFVIFLKIPKIIETKRNIRNLLKIDRKIMFSPFFVIIGIMIFLYVAVMDTFFTWFTSYFESLNIAVFKSALFLAVYSVSLLVGLLIKSQLQKRMEDKKLLLWGILLALVFMVLIFFIKNLIVKNIVLFLYGLSITGNFSLLIIISMGLGSKYASTVATYLHAAAYLGSIVFQYLSGFLTEHFSKNSVFYIDIALLFLTFILAIIINSRRLKIA